MKNRCPICKLDYYSPSIHRQSHLEQAARELLRKSEEWPELEKYFLPLKKAFNLRFSRRKKVVA